ncbi:response regulator receiver domain [Gordonia sp. NPDC003585]|uniref:response regulator receiver domain n=1 Tax=Gordonia sp. NPDC003585 TaxID=3154275 RepID=UPI0033A82862
MTVMLMVDNRIRAERFLRTAVLVDDMAFGDSPDGVMTASLEGGLPELGNDSAGPRRLQADLEGGDAVVGTEALDAKSVISGFAALGITCAILPPEGPDLQGARNESILALAKTADLVVLDWVIDRVEQTEGGGSFFRLDTNLKLLLEVLSADRASGNRLRLVCIYTGHPNLSGIRDEILKKLGETASSVSLPVPTSAIDYIDFNGARVVLVNKSLRGPHVANESPDEEGEVVYKRVAESDLAAFAVGKFSDFVLTGTLPEAALGALTAVRDNAHLILRRFSSDMDPALLNHRALTSEAAAGEYLLELIADEVSSVVTSYEAGASIMADSRVEARIQELLDSNSAEVSSNHDEIKKYFLGRSSNIPKKDRGVGLLVPGSESDASNAVEVDNKFSVLSSFARDGASYGLREVAPILSVGTVIAPVGGDGQGYPYFLICLHPACDSVFRSGDNSRKKQFPFLEMKVVDDDSRNFHLIAQDRGSYVRAYAESLSFANLVGIDFRAADDCDSVQAVWQRKDARWCFEPTDTVKSLNGPHVDQFVWVGDLRTGKAHKLLQSIANLSSRIGLNEYEHLRIQAKDL